MNSVCVFVQVGLVCLLAAVLGCSTHGTGGSGRLDASEGFSDAQVVALATAAQNGDVAEIDRLVAAGVDVNTVGREGVTPLLWAFFAQNKPGFKRLLEHGATPNIQTKNGDSVMNSTARFANDSEWLELAIKHGGDPNFALTNNRFIPGRTPIFTAINKHHTKGVELLIDAGVDLQHKNHVDETPLEFATHFHHFDIVYLLLTAGADYRIKASINEQDIASLIRDKSLMGGHSQFWRDKVIQFLDEDMAKQGEEK